MEKEATESNMTSADLMDRLIAMLRGSLNGQEHGEVDEQMVSVIKSTQVLLEGLAKNDRSIVEDGLAGLNINTQDELFSEVGKLTRKLHSTMVQFESDLGSNLSRIANSEVSSATSQLESVIKLTDDAAHKVLAAVEDQSATITKQVRGISQLRELLHGRVSACGISEVELESIIEELVDSNKRLSSSNTDILLAQEFQDLSGQTVKKVIKLISDVQSSLVDLVKVFGLAGELPVDKLQEEAAAVGKSYGQDDIDSLLDSLGF